MELSMIVLGACFVVVVANMLTYGRRGRRWGRI